jgi:hypothetical protein
MPWTMFSLSAMVTRGAACVALLVCAVGTGIGLCGCGGGGTSMAAVARGEASTLMPVDTRGVAEGEPFRFFAPSSFWNSPLAADVPVASNSSEMVAALLAEVEALEKSGQGPWINTTSWSVPIYTVSARQHTVRVRLDAGDRSPALERAWDAVPLPADAQPAGGTDAQLVVWQPSTDRLWEFWRLVRRAGKWYASWGGAIRHVSRSSGVYSKAAWPGAEPWWGASASSLSIAGGVITLEDIERGTINHAVAISVSNIREGVYALPARRDDGQSASPASLPEGARLRLNPDLDLAALHLPRLTLMIAEAAQRYGIIVRDRSDGVAFFAQDPVSTGSEPYTGPAGYFEAKYPNQLLASFPWSQLEVLQLVLHSNGYGSRHG